MEEKSNRLQFKFLIPEKLVHVLRFLVNRISRRLTVGAKTRNPISQSLCLLDLKRQDPTPEKFSRLMRQLAASYTARILILKICIYDPDPHLSTNIKGIKRSPTNSALLISCSQAPTIERVGASIVVKIWPRPRWRHVSLTFQLSEVHQSSTLKSILFPTSFRSSPLWDCPPFRRLQLRTK